MVFGYALFIPSLQGQTEEQAISDKQLLIELVNSQPNIELLKELIGEPDREDTRRLPGCSECVTGYMEFRRHWYDTISNEVSLVVISSPITFENRAVVVTDKKNPPSNQTIHSIRDGRPASGALE
jgi:hypothetical protein